MCWHVAEMFFVTETQGDRCLCINLSFLNIEKGAALVVHTRISHGSIHVIKQRTLKSDNKFSFLFFFFFLTAQGLEGEYYRIF